MPHHIDLYAVPGDPLPSNLPVTAEPHAAAFNHQSPASAAVAAKRGSTHSNAKATAFKASAPSQALINFPKKSKLEGCSREWGTQVVTSLQCTWNIVATHSIADTTAIAYNDLNNYK